MKTKSPNLRMNISFRNNELDYRIFDYIDKKRDKSSYIKDLVEKDMKANETSK